MTALRTRQGVCKRSGIMACLATCRSGFSETLALALSCRSVGHRARHGSRIAFPCPAYKPCGYLDGHQARHHDEHHRQAVHDVVLREGQADKTLFKELLVEVLRAGVELDAAGVAHTILRNSRVAAKVFLKKAPGDLRSVEAGRLESRNLNMQAVVGPDASCGIV
eukprot:1194307-Prorocentrum_minimum.AAC.3